MHLLERTIGGLRPGRAAQAGLTGDLRVEQLQYLVRQIPVMAAVNLVNAALVAGLFWSRTGGATPALWWAAASLMALLQLRAWARTRRSPIKKVSDRTSRQAVMQAAVVGAVWGSAGLLFFDPHSIAHQIFLAFVLGGMAAGCVAAINPLPTVCMAYIVPLLSPLMVCLLREGDQLGMVMAALTLVYVVALLLAARLGYSRFVDFVRVRHELGQVRTHLVDAIESTSEAFALFDDKGDAVIQNARFHDFFPDPDAAPRDVERGSIFHQLPDGRWLLSNVRPTGSGGLVCVHADITAIKAKEEALERARDEAYSASRAKSAFLAMMSHELRTPLNAIIGFTEVLQKQSGDTPRPERDGEYLQYVLDSARHLLRIINDLLDLSKIEAGHYELLEEPVDVADVVAGVVQLMGEEAGRKQVRLVDELPPDLPPLRADERALRQMLLNLLSNAVKFTEEGGQVSVGARVDDDGMAVWVADTGIGIAPEAMARVFEPFRQVERLMTRQVEGTGLGVPLVDKLAQLHDGRLELDSTPGEGTTARLRFPAERLTHTARQAPLAIG